MITLRALPSQSARWQAGLRFALLAIGLVAGQAARADDSDMWALLKKPGHIVLLRHANAPETPPDGKVDFKDCKTQRNLDDAGRAQARRVGDAFRKHGITAARLFSSQYCRAMETAKLTRLGPVRELPALNQAYLTDLSGMRESGEKTRKFMKTIPAKQLTVLVSHVTNIKSIADVSLSSAEMAVVHLDASGAVAVDGRIKLP
jgi:phosphohistidine phosphatase SixA